MKNKFSKEWASPIYNTNQNLKIERKPIVLIS